MDNVTHSLTGLAIARTGLNRLCPEATLLLILSSNAPDIDIVAFSRGALRYLEVHRGYTHSLVGIPIMALLSVLLVAALYRRALPWKKAWLLCCLGVAVHLLLDWTNSYGIRLLIPFSSSWFHLDINSLYDGIILAVLLFAAAWPLLGRLVSSEIGERQSAGRATAIFALAFFLGFDLLRAGVHSRTEAQLRSRMYDGMLPLQVASLPTAFNPFSWQGVVETDDAYRLLQLDGTTAFNPDAGRVFFKPAMSLAYKAAASSEAFRYFLYFARFPVWSEQEASMGDEAGILVDLTDLRFGTPGAGAFHCIAIENKLHQVQRAFFTFNAVESPASSQLR